MTQMQKEVDDYISQFKAGYFSPLANLARLTEEVGELSREINHSLDIDMTESFNETMDKFNTRDHDRFERK